jgi:hypothetical protein
METNKVIVAGIHDEKYLIPIQRKITCTENNLNIEQLLKRLFFTFL